MRDPGTFGLSDRIDATLVVPFSKITLKTRLKSGSAQYFFDKNSGAYTGTADSAAYNAGSASGIGDVLVNVKVGVLKYEKSRLAFGGEVRFPTGDEFNFLGTGAYGFKPYVIFSRNGRITPHVNLGYQWNSFSALYPKSGKDSQLTGGNLRLPDSLQYSAGADIHITTRLTFVGDLIGQRVFQGVRLTLRKPTSVGPTGTPPPFAPPNTLQCDPQWSCQTISSVGEDYNMNNLGVGLKFNPVGNLLIFGNALIKLDNGGLRAKVVPLLGISYRF